MWQIKRFKTKEAMHKWLDKNKYIQYNPIIVENGYGIEWRPLRILLDYEDEIEESNG